MNQSLDTFINTTEALFLIGMVVMAIFQLTPYFKKNSIWKNIAILLDSLIGITVVSGYLGVVFALFIERNEGAKQVWMTIFIVSFAIFVIALVIRIWIWRVKIAPRKNVDQKETKILK